MEVLQGEVLEVTRFTMHMLVEWVRVGYKKKLFFFLFFFFFLNLFRVGLHVFAVVQSFSSIYLYLFYFSP